MSEDLWGDLPEHEDIETPYDILSQQATALYQKTTYKIKGDVEREHYGSDIVIQFRIVVPSLNNFQYDLLRCVHSATAIYPVTVRDEGSGFPTYKCESPSDFKGRLAAIFASPRVRKALSSLLAQAE